MSARLGEETGASAVMVGIMILALVGMLALTVDGGLLWTQFRRMRGANDAAALAAAYSCASGEGMAGADAMATQVATANVGDASLTGPNEYPQGCEVVGGEVTVNYGGEQGLLFGPAIGISSPRPVNTQATAAWGGAGGATNVVPLMLSMNRLSDCDIPDGAFDGTLVEGVSRCFFWWDNGTRNDQTELTNAEWGLVDLSTWASEPWDRCPGTVSQNEFGTWVSEGYPGSLLLETTPTYVCRGTGFQGNALNNDIEAQAGEILYFPVNDSSRQVRRGGALCRPDGLDGPCSVYRYAIIGFAALEVDEVWTGQQARVKCNHQAQNNGSLRCLEAIWQGFQPGGLLVGGGGHNFGLFAVALTA